MYDREKALKDILACVGRINEQLPPDDRIAQSADTLLVGEGSRLESLTLVNLMVEIEETVSASSGRRVSILEEALMQKEGARFSTIGELSEWIAGRT